jgi:hypothetical protein
MRCAIATLTVVVLCAPPALTGQARIAQRHDATLRLTVRREVQRGTWRRATVHYGKWLVAATAVTLTWMGAHEHARSSREWEALMGLCRADNARCALAPDGRYLDAAAERHYQAVLHYDRRARVRLLSGQGALLAAAGLFLIDLRNGKDGPKNIPLAPLEIATDPLAGQVGVRLRL